MTSEDDVDARDVPEGMLKAEAELLAPGGAFETEPVDVLGERIDVFKNRARSLRELVANSVGFGDAEYLVFTDGVTERRITFAEHERAVASVAAALHDRYGVGAGDRVAILAANCPEWIVTFWATVSLGAVAVGLNGWWTGPEIRYGISDSEPKLLVADAKRLARLDGDDPGVSTVVIDNEFDALWRHDLDAALFDTPIAEDDPAVILYTSGTTGRPKGAVNTHRNVNALIGINFFHGLRMLMVQPPTPDAPPTCQLVTSPLFHVSGLHNGAVAFLVGGVKSVWITGRFDPALALRLIEAERITGWGFTTALLHRLVNDPDVERYDLSSIRQLGGGGSPLSRALHDRTKAVFPQVRDTMGVGYGLTESSALVSINPGPELEQFPDSVGRPLPTVEVEIRDPFGAPLADGEEGEIHVRGPIVMLEYWRRPGDTADVIGSGRWLKTGDIGRLEGGRLYLSSRKRDLILRGGENVYPYEIEERIEEHESVGEVAVVGVDHEELGQEVKAIVVAAPGATIDIEELRAWVAAELAYYKVPARWEVRDDPLPRNALGKVMKTVLMTDAANTFVEE
ncbi:MAG TPA: class I adenylate-forming enzyme family protein [Acidimicrobiia bacterium]